MPIFESQISPNSDSFRTNREGMLGLIEKTQMLEKRSADKSAKAKPRFDKRGQLLPRERLNHLLDKGAPFLEICNMMGYLWENDDPDTSLAGGGAIAGIGYVSGVRVMIAATDSGIHAGAIDKIGWEKIHRCQEIALVNKLPFIHLVESAGANLMVYKLGMFMAAGTIFKGFAKLSAAGCPVITVLHGTSTAGGAYMPGLSDIVIGVRGRGQAFLAGPPLVKAATGEVANAADLGGAEMHASITGLVEHLAENDADAIRLAREVVGKLKWEGKIATRDFQEPRYSPDELAGVVPLDYRQPYDVQEVIARLVDDSDMLVFKARYGTATVCVQGSIFGYPVGFIGNNGPIDPDGATKVAQFIQLCCQSNTPLVFLQNTTGFLVGTAVEQAGAIKHGSKMVQAVTNATVPRFTLHIGASFGAGNYGMCGWPYDPNFIFSWPNAITAVMGGEQAAMTMRLVSENSAKRRGKAIDTDALDQQDERIVSLFKKQSSAFYVSGQGYDDGIIDPRDSRKVLGFLLMMTAEAESRTLHPNTFGVARL